MAEVILITSLQRKIGIIASLLVMLFMAWQCTRFAKFLWLANRSSHWAATVGVIKESRPERSPKGKGWLYLSYSYSVNGQEFIGNNVYPGFPNFDIKENWKVLQNEFYVNRSMVVYYDPDNPQICALRQGTDYIVYVVFFATLILAISTPLVIRSFVKANAH